LNLTYRLSVKSASAFADRSRSSASLTAAVPPKRRLGFRSAPWIKNLGSQRFEDKKRSAFLNGIARFQFDAAQKSRHRRGADKAVLHPRFAFFFNSHPERASDRFCCFNKNRFRPEAIYKSQEGYNPAQSDDDPSADLYLHAFTPLL
jgi:hypothetical protein